MLESASFSVDGFAWNVPFIQLLKDGSPKSVRNICAEEHVRQHIPHIQNKDVAEELLKCEKNPADKRIILRNDHGMDVLEDFSKRLVRCPYVLEVINSLPYNPYERKFIKRVRENGLIEIVLHWTDEGYGIIVKTTGRSIRETERIAEILRKEYGYL